MTTFFNRISNRNLRKNLRGNRPQPEILLWSKLRSKGLGGFKFRRQNSIGPFILDFYCPKLKLAIEIDGESHFSASSIIADKKRQLYVESFGIRFLRFTNTEVTQNIEGVMQKIEGFFRNLSE